jgi:hypothetical protein
MKNNLIFILLISCCFCFSGYSQNSFCSNFSITGVYQDTIDLSTYQVSVEFSAPDSIFVGYTLISSVLDCNGDTIATGNLFWFGQIGQTTQDYPITLIGQPNCAPYTAVFTYMDELGDIDTCMLLYSTADVIDNKQPSPQVSIYPNPASDELFIHGIPADFNGEMVLLNHFGQVVQKSPFKNNIPIESLATGWYVILLSDQEQEYKLKFAKN